MRKTEKNKKGFYFQNEAEFITYVKLYGDEEVKWLSGDDYIKEYEKGYRLFCIGKYIEAIDVLKGCLQLNPIGINARFELCEAYLKTNQQYDAWHTLLDMKDLLTTETQIARFYRRIGYIEIERTNYRIANACYKYSMQFEYSPSAENELKYIQSKSIFSNVKNPEKVIKSAGLPLLTPKTLIDPDTFLEECMVTAHATSSKYNEAVTGHKFVPELLGYGIIVQNLLDNDYYYQFKKQGIDIYYYVLLSLSLQTGLIFALQWHRDYSALSNPGFVKTIMEEGPSQNALVILNQYFPELSEDQGNAFNSHIFSSMYPKLKPFLNRKNSREYVEKFLLSGYQLGVSMMLEKLGYTN